MTASTVTGWPIGTIVRGRRVMWEGALAGPGRGPAGLFAEASKLKLNPQKLLRSSLAGRVASALKLAQSPATKNDHCPSGVMPTR